MNEQTYGQVPFQGMGTDPGQSMQFLHTSRPRTPIQPSIPIIDGSGGIPLYNQQYGSGNMQYNANQQWTTPQQRVPSHSGHNEGNLEGQRDTRSPMTDQSDAGGPENKIYLRPDGDTFFPYQGVVSKIVEIMAGKFPGRWPTWGDVPQAQRDIWFNEFKKYYYWHPDNDVAIRRNFESRGAARLRDIFGTARKNNKKPKWLAPSLWNEMLKYWNENENFKKLSERNKQNKNSNVEGFGPSKHTCGSIAATERKRRLAEKLGRPPTYDELFKDTHCTAKNKSFVDQKSARKYEDYCKQWEEYSQAATQGGSQRPPMTPEQFWLKQNLDRKGRVYGFGTEGGTLKKSATMAVGRHSSAEHYDLREQVARLNETAAKQAEAMSSHKKEMKKLKKKHTTFKHKIFKFFKSQSAGSSSQPNIDEDEHENEDEDDDDDDDDADDPMNLSD